MQYLLTKEFTKINETSGTIQNPCLIRTIEMSTTNEPDNGILIKPNQQHTFQNATIYLRCPAGRPAEVRIVPFNASSSGGGSSSSGDTTGDYNDPIEDIWNGDTTGDNTSYDPDWDSELNHIFNP